MGEGRRGGWEGRRGGVEVGRKEGEARTSTIYPPVTGPQQSSVSSKRHIIKSVERRHSIQRGEGEERTTAELRTLRSSQEGRTAREKGVEERARASDNALETRQPDVD